MSNSKKYLFIAISFILISASILINNNCSKDSISPVLIPNEFSNEELFLGMHIDTLKALNIVDTISYDKMYDSYSGILINNNFFKYIYLNVENEYITSFRFDGRIDTLNSNTTLNPMKIFDICINHYGENYKIYNTIIGSRSFPKEPYIVWKENDFKIIYRFTPKILFDKIIHFKRSYTNYSLEITSYEKNDNQQIQNESEEWTPETLGLIRK